MTMSKFYYILEMIKGKAEKHNTNYRRSLTAAEKLLIEHCVCCMFIFATGNYIARKYNRLENTADKSKGLDRTREGEN